MSDRSTHWDNVYATKGEAEVSWFQDSPAISLEMIGSACPDHGAAIIDIGGGASRLVDALLRDGYRDLAVLDLSATRLKRRRSESAGRPQQSTGSLPTPRHGGRGAATTSGTIARHFTS